MEAAASPLPRDETTPPVTKMNFGVTEDLLSSTAPASNRRRPRAHQRASARAHRASDRAGVPGPGRQAALAALLRPPRPPRKTAPGRRGLRGGTTRSPVAPAVRSPAMCRAPSSRERAGAAPRREIEWYLREGHAVRALSSG